MEPHQIHESGSWVCPRIAKSEDANTAEPLLSSVKLFLFLTVEARAVSSGHLVGQDGHQPSKTNLGIVAGRQLSRAVTQRPEDKRWSNAFILLQVLECTPTAPKLSLVPSMPAQRLVNLTRNIVDSFGLDSRCNVCARKELFFRLRIVGRGSRTAWLKEKGDPGTCDRRVATAPMLKLGALLAAQDMGAA